jgi:putative ABC transport system substrate-binding protein
MNRREFIAGLGGAAAWPLTAHAQQSMPVIGFLNSASPPAFARFVAAFREGLKESGFIEGQNVMIEYRWAEGHYDRLPALAADLVQRRVAVIAAAGGEFPALAAKAATSTIPIVFVFGSDPAKFGLVMSRNRPEGNVTGIIHFTTALESKRIGLLHEMVPKAETIAALVNPTRAIAETQIAEVRAATSQTGARLVVVTAFSEAEFDAAFKSAVEQKADALQVCADPYFFSQYPQLVALAERFKLPAMYEWRDFADAGGLMSYGTLLTDSYRQNGNYIGRILKGATPADLPVSQNTRFEFVINLKTAKALGLEVPLLLQQRADEVIE